jgi:site-specific DNA recombinase
MSEQMTAAPRLAAIYARVSSERQRSQQTIASQVVGLRELAASRGLIVAEELVFLDDGFSGASLQRPALERLRDRAAEGAFEVLLCHAPDRLARRYAYQVLVLEELTRTGVEVCFAKEGERSGSPEDELLRQFQGMIAEYERAQIAERTRRGKVHRARQGSQAVLSGAPYGYRYVRKSEFADAYYEIEPAEAEVVRQVFDRYTADGQSIADIARALGEQGIATRTAKTVWDRSTVWGMLRNPAYRGQAAFGKTATSGQRAKPTRPARARGERHGRRETRHDRPAEEWTHIPVPALVSDEQFELAQARLAENKRFAARATKEPTLLQGILVCRECGYACYRTQTRTSRRTLYYYRCIGSDNYRHAGGRVCTSRPIRADELDELVWGQVSGLLTDPALVRDEIDRRLKTARREHPATQRRDGLQRELRRVQAATERLIEAYQEQLISLDELRARTPELRTRETTISTQLDALDSELHDAETYLKLAEGLEGFLARLADRAATVDVRERQRVLRLIVREVLIGGDGDITIRHSIPTPTGGPDGTGCPLRGSSQDPALRGAGDRRAVQAVLGEDPGPQERLHQTQDALICDPISHPSHQGRVVDLVEARRDVGLKHPLVRARGEVVDLGDRVLGPALRAKAVRTRLEVRLEDRLEHQLQHGLHDPVGRGRDAKTPELARRLGDHLLPHPGRGVPASLQIVSEPRQELPVGGDGSRSDAIDAGRACALVGLDPVPRHNEERGVIDEVVEVIKPAARVADRPVVQLGLHREYSPFGLIRAGPRSAGIHQRPPRSASSLRTCWTPSPCGRLSRPRTTTGPPPHPGDISRR